MTDVPVRVFFYGSFMSPEVLARAGYVPARLEVARLRGFDIRLDAMATLVRDERGVVYGVLCEATHQELERLYGAGSLAGAYGPEAVLVELLDGGVLPALCYVAYGSPPPAPAGYLDGILTSARRHGFPTWYVERLESFRSPAS